MKGKEETVFYIAKINQFLIFLQEGIKKLLLEYKHQKKTIFLKGQGENMEQLEKVEKLRQRANVSYEEAKEALEASAWDLLDAMVYLEKQGKVKPPSQESYTTNCDEQTQYVDVKEKVQEQEEEASRKTCQKLGHLFRIFIRKTRDNAFCVSRKGEEILRIPVIAMLILLLFFWQFLIPAAVIALFFDCRYSFKGKDDLEGMNRAMEKAGEFADKVKDEYEKL